MKLRYSLLLCLTVLAVALTGGVALAAPEGIGTKTVRDVNTTISKALATKVTTAADEAKLLEQARSKLGGFLNIEELGQRALKDHWPKLTTEQRAEFLKLLRGLIETNYVKGLRTNLKYDVTYLGEKKQGDYLLVQTVITSERKGRPLKIEIDYLLSKSGDTWRTFDMTTDGIGLVENYRAMFNKLIAKSGFDGLLERMRTKLAALSK